MSDTATPPSAAASPVDVWLSPQTIIAVMAMLIVAGTVAAVFWRGDDATINYVTGGVMGTIAGGVMGFYFASSVGSQRKAAAPTPTTGATP